MRKLINGLLVALCAIQFAGCDLEGSDEFGCGDEPDETLFENAPADTVYVKVESTFDPLNRTLSGIRLDQPDGFVEGEYENLLTFEREARPDNGRLFGLGTQIVNDEESSKVIIAFNLLTGSQLSETCRSTKVFKREHDWSRWYENIAGVEILMTVPIDGELVTFSSDTGQLDDDLLYLDGAEFLDGVGFYAKLSGSFTVMLKELNPDASEPREAKVSGSFIMDMRISR